MPTPITIQFDALIMCLTCGYSPSPSSGRGLVVHNEKINEHGHEDYAHMPNWVVDSDVWELVDPGEIEPGDVLATGETVHTVTHADLDEILTWPDTEDGQSSVITDRRTGKVGWPGQSKIVRRVR